MIFAPARSATSIIAACLLVSCGAESPAPKAKAAPQDRIIEGPIKNAAGNIFAADPKIRNVRLVKSQGATIWELGVDDDGMPQFEFADEACATLHENGIGKGNHVRIVDASTLQPNAPAETSLGWVNCDTGVRLYL